MDNKQDSISSYKITISYSRKNKHKNKHIIQKGLSQYTKKNSKDINMLKDKL